MSFVRGNLTAREHPKSIHISRNIRKKPNQKQSFTFPSTSTYNKSTNQPTYYLKQRRERFFGTSNRFSLKILFLLPHHTSPLEIHERSHDNSKETGGRKENEKKFIINVSFVVCCHNNL